MTTKAERERTARQELWLKTIGTSSLFDIAQVLLECYVHEKGGMIAEYGNKADFEELHQEEAAYRARLAELEPNRATP